MKLLRDLTSINFLDDSSKIYCFNKLNLYLYGNPLKNADGALDIYHYSNFYIDNTFRIQR